MMQKNIYRKGIVFAIIIIFLATGFNSVTSLKLCNSNISLTERQFNRDKFFPSDFIYYLPIENKAMKILSNNYKYNIGQSVMQTDDNGFIVTGYKQEFDFWNPSSDIIQDIILFKNNVNGDREWKKTFEFLDDSMGNSIQQTDDKGYIIGGSISSLDNTYALLLKTDEQGNEEWIKTYAGLENAIAYSVQQTNDNGFILTGSSSYSNNEYVTYLLLLKTDELGNLEWNKTFYFDNISMGYSVKQTEDLGYIITGYTGQFEFEPGVLNFELKVLVIKTDENGDEEWIRILELMDINIGSCVECTKDGGYIIGGTAVEISEFTSFTFLLKMDEQGNEQWHKTFSGSYGKSVQQTDDNGYIIGGSAISSSNTYAMLLKTDETGNELWTKTYKGLGISLCNSVQQTVDNGFVLTGATSGSIYSSKVYVFILKTDASGNLVWSQTLKNNIPKSSYRYNLMIRSQNTFLQKFFKNFSVLKRLFI